MGVGSLLKPTATPTASRPTTSKIWLDEVNHNTSRYVANAPVRLKHGALVCVHLSSVPNVPEYLF